MKNSLINFIAFWLLVSGIISLQSCEDESNVAEPEFEADHTSINVGDSVRFYDQTISNGTRIESRQWTFEGGTPYSSTVQNPVIKYFTPGSFKVALSVTYVNSNRETLDNSISRDDYIYVTSVNPGACPTWRGRVVCETKKAELYETGTYVNTHTSVMSLNADTTEFSITNFANLGVTLTASINDAQRANMYIEGFVTDLFSDTLGGSTVEVTFMSADQHLVTYNPSINIDVIINGAEKNLYYTAP